MTEEATLFWPTLVARPTKIQEKPKNPLFEKILEIVLGHDTILPNVSEAMEHTAPSVSLESSACGFTIMIDNIPEVANSKANSSALERIINHLKDGYLQGSFSDTELEDLCGNREFRFCITYTFTYNVTLSRLIIDFYISYTEGAPVWVNYKTIPSKGKKHADRIIEDSVTSMSQNEVDLVAQACGRQCVHALANYIHMVYNDAIAKGIEPDYYTIPKPAAAKTQ